MTDPNICGYCGGDKDIAKIAKRMGYRPDVAFAQLAKAEQRIEQLEAIVVAAGEYLYDTSKSKRDALQQAYLKANSASLTQRRAEND